MPTLTILFSLLLLPSGPLVKSDETVTLFPTYASHDPDKQQWQVHIHGWIYEPETNSIKRAIALRLFQKFLGLPQNSPQTANFRKRARPFLVDNTENRKISVHFASQVYPAGKSGDDGHFNQIISIPDSQLDVALKPVKTGQPWLTYQVITDPNDTRSFTGQILLIPPTGLSVISDIDDTIKITNVRNRQATIANTFLHDYKPVPGMPDLYRRWADKGAVFHYVSGSPWPLYQPLSDFLQTAGFPPGTFHLRTFEWFGADSLEMFAPPEKMKLKIINQILRDFPKRQFILVGDTTEKDPEVYAHFAAAYPHQIRHIYIRNVTNESLDSERFKKIIPETFRSRWTLFTDPGELTPTSAPSAF